ncbi:MAG: hypothetical protein GY850_10510 [bacterium]|nr:hypothetical protein [bacterium]
MDILLREPARAEEAFDAGRLSDGVFRLDKYRDHVETLDHQGRIDAEQADLLVGQSDDIIGCVWSN